MFKKPITFLALAINGLIAFVGLWNAQQLADFAQATTNILFESRGWFIMLSVTTFVIVCLWLALSPYGRLKLGQEDEQPEFSTISWLAMLFSAGMGVGLLYWGSAEPLSHFALAQSSELFESNQAAATGALFVTNFHWGIHAWGIFASLALIIAFFSFRKGTPTLISAPIREMFKTKGWSGAVAGACDLMAFTAVSIGVAGSIAMGVFQVQSGIAYVFNWGQTGLPLALGIFALLFVSYLLPLTVDLSRGMSLISNACMAIASFLLIFVLITGPTHFLMNAIVDTLGNYVANVLQHGLSTYTFEGEVGRSWFKSWTLTYMIWWIAWAPFVSVFIARISRGRTIREFVLMVMLVPTLFSLVWFGVFGGGAFYAVLREGIPLLELLETNLDGLAFEVLALFPLSQITVPATILVSFLFVVTSVVSAAYVLAMFSDNGNPDPSSRGKLTWGVIIGLLGVIMILTGNIEAVRAIIALGAMPFVFIILLLLMCLLKDLKTIKSEKLITHE